MRRARESYIKKLVPKQIMTGSVSSCSITTSEMAIVTECEVANVMECELTNEVEEQIQECMEQIQQCLHYVNNLNSVSLVKHYAPVNGVVNNLEINHNI